MPAIPGDHPKMKAIFHLIALSLLLTACSTKPTLVDLPVRMGMSKDELRHTYGSPVRTVKNADGSEDWFYRIGSRSKDSHSFSETSTSFPERSTTYGVG